VSTLITLVFVPTLYSIFEERIENKVRKLDNNEKFKAQNEKP
ncbi:unnamed protein product, partial [marine sediment metagenome]